MHATNDLRGTFERAVELYPRALSRGTVDELAIVLGKLWNCTDIMPAALCGDLELPAGSTFAQGARVIKRWLRRASKIQGTTRRERLTAFSRGRRKLLQTKIVAKVT